MKNEFNFRSLAKALAEDISPSRIHKNLKEVMDIRQRSESSSRFDQVSNHVGAALLQTLGMLFGAKIGLIPGYLAAKGVGASDAGSLAGVAVGAIAGALLMNPLIAKAIMKYFEVSDRAIDRLFNKIAGNLDVKETELRQYPPFEAFPEFRKAWAGNEPKPQ